MSQQDDSSFFRTFGVVLGALVLFTVFIAIVANIYSPGSDRATDPLVQQETARQIAPVGQSRVEESAALSAEAEPVETDESAEPSQSSTAPEADADAGDAGVASDENAAADDAAQADDVIASEQPAADPASVAASAAQGAEIPVRVKAVVATNCAGCHRDGLLGAQRTDDVEAWQALQDKGLEALTASVINGKGAMLPRAETTLSDEEIALAIRHMIDQSAGGGADATDTSSEPLSETDVNAEEAVIEAEEDSSSSIDESDAAAVDAVSEESAVEEAKAAETAGETAAAPVAMSEIPANVKGVVDGLCAGCHISGVANAPKYGDKAAWDERLSMGMDKLLASAIAGKGAMPARGGSQLSDAELRLAIEYMASK